MQKQTSRKEEVAVDEWSEPAMAAVAVLRR
jgi:hypothetical protein